MKGIIATIASSLLLVIAAKAWQVSDATRLGSGDLEVEGTQCVMDSAAASSAAMEDIIVAYRDTVFGQLRGTLCVSDQVLLPYRPDGTLLRLAADMLLAGTKVLAEAEGYPVPTLAVMNAGGIRDVLPEGNVTTEDVIKVSPFDNKAVVVVLDSARMTALVDHIASRGGEAVSGMSFELVGAEARNLLVNGEPLRGDRQYVLATIDYIANGGDSFECLVGAERYTFNAIAHKIFVEYLRSLGKTGEHLVAPADARITVAS